MSEHAPGTPRAGWNPAKPEVIPRATPWPAGLALGIMFLGWGVVTSPLVLILGLAVFAVALWGWIAELRREP